MTRPTFNEYYLGIAKAVSARSTCLRRKYGAVLVKNNKIVATGYNGSAAGEVNCSDSGKCVRKEMGIEPGTRYELCTAIHGEMNCLLSASREDTQGATLYIVGTNTDDGSPASGKPCMMCARIIKNAGISSIIY